MGRGNLSEQVSTRPGELTADQVTKNGRAADDVQCMYVLHRTSLARSCQSRQAAEAPPPLGEATAGPTENVHGRLLETVALGGQAAQAPRQLSPRRMNR